MESVTKKDLSVTENDKIEKHHQLVAVEKRASDLNIEISTTLKTTPAIASEISKLAKKQPYSLVLVGWQAPVTDSTTSTSNDALKLLRSLKSNLQNIVDIGLQEIFGIQDQLPGGKIIRDILGDVKSPVAVLVDRGLDEEVAIQKVLLVFTGESQDWDALSLVSQMRAASVTILTNNPRALDGRVGPTVTVQDTDVIDSAFILESSKNFHLLIIGAQRKWWTSNSQKSMELTSVILTSTVSLLVVYPSKFGKDSNVPVSLVNSNEEPKSVLLEEIVEQ